MQDATGNPGRQRHRVHRPAGAAAGMIATAWLCSVPAMPMAQAQQDPRAAAPPQAGLATPAEQLPEPTVTEPGPLYALPTTLDGAGRILVPVEINGTGPYRFVLDTGANRSALSRRLVDRLGLVPGSEQLLQVHGMTGAAMLAAVDVSDFRVGDFRLRGLQLPVLEPNVLAGTDGILGVTELERARIEVDFANDRVEVHQSSRRSTPPGWVRTPVDLVFRGLLTAPVRIGRVRAMAIIDTGAERSLGNRALLNALVARSFRDADARASTVIGVTPQFGEVVSVRIPSIAIAGARLTDMEVLFGDLYIFDVWGLKSEPALVIGMDLLGTVERLIVDYGRRQILMKP